MGGQAQIAARAIAAGRVVIGAAPCVAPDLTAHWAGADARTPGAQLITRALGARDAALGVGTLAAAGDPVQLRRWLLVSSACDAADFAATLAGPRSPARPFVLASAAMATVAGLLAAGTVEIR
jgi:hypothetical protein